LTYETRWRLALSLFVLVGIGSLVGAASLAAGHAWWWWVVLAFFVCSATMVGLLPRMWQRNAAGWTSAGGATAVIVGIVLSPSRLAGVVIFATLAGLSVTIVRRGIEVRRRKRIEEVSAWQG